MNNFRTLIDLVESAGLPARPDLVKLKQHFDEFNRLYFDGKIPEMPLSFKKMKNVGGVFLSKSLQIHKYAKRQLIRGSESICIDTTYARSQEEIDKLLLHELIHAWVVCVENDLDDNHGPAFMRKLREVSQKSGIDIPLTEKIDNLLLSNQTPKPVGVIVQSTDRGPAYAIVSANILQGKSAEIQADWMKRYYAEKHPLKAYVVTSPGWTVRASRDTVQRNTKKLAYFYIKDEDLIAEITSMGKLVFDTSKT